VIDGAARLIETMLKKAKTKKLQEKVKKFNVVNTKFKSTDNLNPKIKKLLHALETRAEHIQSGDTKICDRRLADLFEVTRKTISRWLKTLEEMGYIRRLSIQYKSNKDSKVYSDRTIRCLRIFLKMRFRFKETLKWKVDYRPEFKLQDSIDLSTGEMPDFQWYVTSRGSGTKGGKEFTYAPKWETELDLLRMDILDVEQRDMMRELVDRYESGREDKMTSIVLGLNPAYRERKTA
jgi:DNA-binding MarR family transcriptional regulator